MSGYRHFEPDLIVEATMVCDRKCAGCYAPNLFSKKSVEEIYKTFPDLFIDVLKLQHQLDSLASRSNNLNILSIRGGEPSKHPRLTSIIEVCSQYAEVILETHGRWIIHTTHEFKNQILEVCSRTNTLIKLSYDQMHGLSATEVREITETLTNRNVQWVVAITESSRELFLKTRGTCSWAADDQIIFQKKVNHLSELVSPTLGIIQVDGSLRGHLSARPSFSGDKDNSDEELLA